MNVTKVSRLARWVAAAAAVCGGMLYSAVPAGAAPTIYTYKLIDVPGSGLTQAFGVNNAGDVVGTYGDGEAAARGNAPIHGFLYSHGAFCTVDVPGEPGTIPQAIADNGTIAGFSGLYDQTCCAHTALHGFVFDHSGFTTVDQAGYGVNFVTDLTDRGDVIGFSSDGNGRPHAYRIRDGVQTVLTAPGSDYAYTAGLAENGWMLLTNSGGAWRVRGDVAEHLDLAPGANFVSVTGTNNRGDIVGVVNQDGIHGYIYRQGRLTLIDVPGADATEVLGVNDKGSVVGQFYVNGIHHGFVATPHGGN
jgi:hypothetical protein